jgi:hypothetical protein
MPHLASNNNRIGHGGMYYQHQELLFMVLTVMATIALGLMVVWVVFGF